MATTPRLKVHTPDGEYVASCKYYEDAAAIAGSYGEGAYIRHADIPGAKGIVWREGRESISAADSYDEARDIMSERVEAAFNKTA